MAQEGGCSLQLRVVWNLIFYLPIQTVHSLAGNSRGFGATTLHDCLDAY